ncbi:hypothetical protein ABZV14_17320 [Streptosporangium canum]|uniref:hypothetical protein n=1 Tax=Streptosporangium canum TaxID=324952 RepID=UPI0033AAFF5B
MPPGGRQVLISLTVRRLTFGNPGCEVRTFAEPISGLARRHARSASLMRRMLERLALAGRAGSRLLGLLGVMG